VRDKLDIIKEYSLADKKKDVLDKYNIKRT